MSRKILVVVLTIALAAALIGGTTMAWFTDSSSSNPVEFTAGTVLIEAGSSSITSQYFDPSDGVFVYGVAGGTGDLYEVDIQNQTENKIYANTNSYSGFYPNALAFDDANDRLYFAANRNKLWYYDFSANQLVDAGAFTHTGNSDVYAATFGGGYYWYVPNGTGNLYQVSLDSNGLIESSTVTPMTTSSLAFGDVEIDYANGIIYGSTTSFYFTYDTGTGEFTRHGSAGKGMQLAWGHDGNLYGHNTNAREWFSVEPAGGAKTFLFTGERSYNDLATGSKSYWNPGDCSWAKFNVKNVGTKNSYVRVELSGYWTEYDDAAGKWVPWTIDPAEFPDSYQGDVVTFQLSNGMGNWEQAGGYYYYNKVLAPNETAELGLEICLLGPETCNAYQGKRFVMTGTFDAIQTTHGASQEVWGWSPGN